MDSEINVYDVSEYLRFLIYDNKLYIYNIFVHCNKIYVSYYKEQNLNYEGESILDEQNYDQNALFLYFWGHSSEYYGLIRVELKLLGNYGDVSFTDLFLQ